MLLFLGLLMICNSIKPCKESEVTHLILTMHPNVFYVSNLSVALARECLLVHKYNNMVGVHKYNNMVGGSVTHTQTTLLDK